MHFVRDSKCAIETLKKYPKYCGVINKGALLEEDVIKIFVKKQN